MLIYLIELCILPAGYYKCWIAVLDTGPLYKYNTFYLYFLLLMDIGFFFPIPGHYETKPKYTPKCMSPGEHIGFHDVCLEYICLGICLDMPRYMPPLGNVRF